MKNIVLYGLAAVVLAWIGYKLFPNDERAIRRQLDSLSATVSIAPGESSLNRLANASKVADFFTQDVTGHIDGVNLSVNDRGDLREAVLAARSRLNVADIQFLGVHVRFPEDRQHATVFLTAVAHIDGETNAFSRSMKMTFRKIDRDWLVSRFESVALGQ